MTDSLFEAVAHATHELTKYGFSTQELVVSRNFRKMVCRAWHE